MGCFHSGHGPDWLSDRGAIVTKLPSFLSSLMLSLRSVSDNSNQLAKKELISSAVISAQNFFIAGDVAIFKSTFYNVARNNVCVCVRAFFCFSYTLNVIESQFKEGHVFS